VILGSEKAQEESGEVSDRSAQWSRVYDADDGLVWVRRSVNPSVR
jgi:hypothetical protein